MVPLTIPLTATGHRLAGDPAADSGATVGSSVPRRERTARTSRSGRRFSSPRAVSLLGLLLAGWCIWTSFPANQPEPLQASQTTQRLVTTPIGEMQLGQRVLAEHPELAGQQIVEVTVDPNTWQSVSLVMEKSNGGTLEVDLLRPPGWILQLGIEPGATVNLDLPEMGVAGPAKVVSVSAYPPIEEGNGKVVTGLFRHTAGELLNVAVEGIDDPIGTTPEHPFWSEDRQAFIPAGDLRAGETLRLVTGNTVRITGITRRGPPEPVYNLEVSNQHVYYVSDAGVLVHNSYLPTLGPKRDALGRFTSNAGGHTADAARGIEAHRNYRNALGGRYDFEFTLPSGRRVDAIDIQSRIVRELKPNNPRTIQDGSRQLERYRQELQREFGGTWTSFMDIYQP